MKGKGNKKSIGVIVAVVFVLLVGLIGGTGNSGDADITTTMGQYLGSDIAPDNAFEAPSVSENSDDTGAQGSDEYESTSESISEKSTTAHQVNGNYRVNLNSLPAFSGKAYIAVNDNVPGLTAKDRKSTYFEEYTSLDYLDRCGVAFACLGKETMPTEERGAIGSVKPSGWRTVKYDFVDGKYLYNRCHLIGFQLSAENANTRNLITGTRYMNVEGMLPFENMVADYIKETNNHVLYRVTPVFKSTELVCRGVQIEAFSVEDNGEGICFNVFCYNNQPGVEIDYATGESWVSKSTITTTQKAEATTQRVESATKKQEATTEAPTAQIIVQPDENQAMVWIPQSGKKYHSEASCSGMKNPTKVTVGEAEDLGYTACGKCY